MKKSVYFISSSLMLLSLFGCGTEESSPDISTDSLSGLAIIPYHQDLPMGYQTATERQPLGTQMHLRFRALATYKDGSTKDVTDSVRWESSNTSLANFIDSSPGELVTYERDGDLEVSASMDSGVTINGDSIGGDRTSGLYPIHVVDNTLEETKLYIDNSMNDVSNNMIPALPNMSVALKAINIYSDGSYQRVSDFVKWDNSNNDVAVLDEQNIGLVSARQLGEDIVSVSYSETASQNASNYRASATVVVVDEDSVDIDLQLGALQTPSSYKSGAYQIPYGLSKTLKANLCLVPDDSIYAELITHCVDVSDKVTWSLDENDEDINKFALGSIVKGRIKAKGLPSKAATESLDNTINVNARLDLGHGHAFDASPIAKVKVIAPKIDKMIIRSGMETSKKSDTLSVLNHSTFEPKLVAIFEKEIGVNTTDISEYIIDNEDVNWVTPCDESSVTSCGEIYVETSNDGVFEAVKIGEEQLAASLKIDRKLRATTMVRSVPGEITGLEVDVNYGEDNYISDKTFDISENGSFTVFVTTESGDRIDVTNVALLSSLNVRSSHFSPDLDKVSTITTLNNIALGGYGQIIIPQGQRTKQWFLGDGLLHVEPTVCLTDELCQTFDVQFSQKPLSVQYDGKEFLISPPIQYGHSGKIVDEDYKYGFTLSDGGYAYYQGMPVKVAVYNKDKWGKYDVSGMTSETALMYLPIAWGDDNYPKEIPKGWDRTCSRIYGDGWDHISSEDSFDLYNHFLNVYPLDVELSPIHGWSIWLDGEDRRNPILSHFHHDWWLDSKTSYLLDVIGTDGNETEKINTHAVIAPIMCKKEL